MPHAIVIGGTTAIGRATARRLLAQGWSVDLAARTAARMPADLTAAGARYVALDRDDPDQLRAACGGGADLLVDNVCYTPAQARAVLPYARAAGCFVVLSSKAVYVDAAGHHSNSAIAPRYDGPIVEDQPTMEPADIPYDSPAGYGANKVAVERTLLDAGVPVTVLRPSKVHGPGALRPREWVFVKRVLDRRPVVLLAHQGAGVDHPTAADNIATLIEAVVAAGPAPRILNSADPDAPTAATIARVVGAHLGHRFTEIALPEDAPPGLGRTPWDRPHPVVLDTTAARRLGWVPAGDYAGTVAAELDWLVAAAAGRAGADRVPADDDPDFAPLLDYAAEDAYLARL